jgi:hypothetical protein
MPVKTPRRFSIVRPRQAIVIPLDDLRRLMREFINEHETDEDLKTSLDWTFELFLQWLRKKKEQENGTKPTN